MEPAEPKGEWLGEKRARQLAGKRHSDDAHRVSVDARDRRALGGAGEWGIDDCADAANRIWTEFRGSGRKLCTKWMFE